MPRTILLIQDDPAEAEAVRAALTTAGDGPFRVEWVRRSAEGLERLIGAANHGMNPVAAVLVDLFLPDSQGMDTFDRLYREAPQIPILVLADEKVEAMAKLAVQHGAQDYLLKSRLDSYLLPKALGNMIERAANAEALFEEKERVRVTLDSIGDAVLCTDVHCRVTYLNKVAEGLTSWPGAEAVGQPIENVFRIIDAASRETADYPMASAIRDDRTVALAANCVLVRRDGTETAIEDSIAPIHDRRGHVSGAVMVFRDVSVSRAQTLRMSYQAQHDILTDLPNRILLDDRLSQAIALARRHDQKLAVLFLDLDRFKHVNDSLGHAVGDRLLQSVAQRLLTCVRASDTVSRQGGDEFVILLSEVTQPQDPAVAADKILVAMSTPHHVGEHDLHLTASIGIVIYPDDGADAATLMRNADSAMYHAKENGRSNYQFFEPDMNLRAVERQSLENGLRTAVERHELVLHYQPKLILDAGTITGVEALVRWRHPQRGLMLPAAFIPIAEESGAIVQIGRWVLREACRQARAWQDAGLPPLSMAVNISTVELRAKGFVAGVRAVLAETGLDPRYLELELTETILMQDSISTAAVLRALKDIGVQLALDDFGTGYSSLSHLRRFPIDTLKIDQTFVRDLMTQADDASIVSAMINMGRSLHMQVVAEGVETREQLGFLREQRCPEGQGHYFSQPLVAVDLAGLLAPLRVTVQ